MYDSFPEDFLGQIKKIDPEGEFLPEFSLELASKGKLVEVSEKDPKFFINSIKSGLEEGKYPDIDESIKRGGYFIETINEYYENPKYQNEKKELENFLVEKYNKAKDPEQKKVYAYFLKLNENPLTAEARELSKTLPEISSAVNVPKRYSDKKTLNAKLYFDNDAQGWFKETKKEYEKYGMKAIQETNREIILSKKLPSGKEIRINLEFTPENTPLKKNEDIFESDEYQLIAHRGHYYTFGEFFTEPSNADKIIYLGGCGSFSRCLPEVQKLYPNSQIISDVDVGEGAINNKAIYEMLEAISDGEREWDKIKPAYAEEQNLIYPDHLANRLRQYVFSK